MELWPDEGVGGVGFDRRGGRRRVLIGVRQRAGNPGDHTVRWRRGQLCGVAEARLGEQGGRGMAADRRERG